MEFIRFFERKLSFKDAIDSAMVLSSQNDELTICIKRGEDWPKDFFWELRDSTHKLEDIQFKPCTVDMDSENPTVKYLPLGVTNQVPIKDAASNDWGLYVGIKKK